MPRASLSIPISERTLAGLPAIVHGHPRARRRAEGHLPRAGRWVTATIGDPGGLDITIEAPK